jgi:DNA repair protein SbcD/Mre11
VKVKILHTSDWHVGRRIGGRDRSDEHEAVLEEIVEIASANSVDLVVVAGDLFDSAAPSPRSESIVWRALLELSRVARVVLVGGNHDNAARLDAVAPLLGLSRITVCATPVGPGDGGVLEIPELATKVALLPFISQRGIVRAAEIMNLDPDEHAGLYGERMRAMIERLTSGMGTETVNILAGHLTVYGALEGGGERQAHIFGYAIPSSSFPGHLSYVALGHLHRQQKMPHGAAVWYSGSPLQLDFGEVEDRKGVLLVEAAPGTPSRVTSVPLTRGRKLVSLFGTLDQVLNRAGDVDGAYVKVELDEKARVGLADEVRAVIPDVVEVKLRASDDRARKSYEERTGVTGPEAFSKYLEFNGVDDRRLLALFDELLDEASA